MNATPTRGFTLLEVLVATSLLCVGVGLGLQLFSSGLGNVERIEKAHRAMEHAENVMNELLSDRNVVGPLRVAADLDEEFSYSATIDYWEPPSTPMLQLDPAQQQVQLLAIVVDVHFKNDRYGKMYRTVCLKSVTLAPPEGGPPGLPTGNPLQRRFGGRR
ncbi:MAG TPA: type II secretion system protein [Acidobacteriota bacterium]|nr:type II secretion system protein [Acidobacteriota bacterium]HRR56992.1 type II secretion system protein [Acidobacteriota bacterium]